MITSRTSVRVLLSLLAFALLSAACGNDDSDDASDASATETTADTATEGTAWDDVVTAAQEEGEVTVYSVFAPSTMDALKAAFEDAYPDITMEYIRGSGGDLQPRIAQEIASGTPGADVMIDGTIPWWEDSVEDGYILPLEAESAQSEAWQTSGWVNEHYAVVQLSPVVIGWNTNLVDEPIHSYQELLERPDLDDTEVITFSLISPNILAIYMHLEDVIPGFLEGLADMDPVLNAEVGPDVQALAAGEVAIAPIAFIPQLNPLIAQGAPIEWAIPEEAYGSALAAGVVANGANNNAGQLFVEFLMSEEGQKVINGSGEAAAPIEGIEGSLEIEHFDTVDVGPANDPAVADPFRQRWESLLG